MGLGAAVSLSANSGKKKVHLVRRYRPGARMVYRTEATTRIALRSNVGGLKSYLPDIPDVVMVRPENTLVVQAVRPDRSAEIQDRFDGFDLVTTVTADPSGRTRATTREVHNALTHEITGATLRARYGPQGKLLGFTGAATLLNHLRSPEKEMAHWLLKLMLSQEGGYGLYPDHPVQVGETWKRWGSATLGEVFPLASDHQDVYRLESVTRYRGVKAGVIVFGITNSIQSVRGTGPSPGLFALLKNEGITLEVGASGNGNGRAIVALGDGRILREDIVLRETFQGSVQGLPGLPLPPNGPASLKIKTNTAMTVVEQPGNRSNRRLKTYGAVGGAAYRSSQRRRRQRSLMSSGRLLQPPGERPKAADAEPD
ncbi:MAG: hypothetical protein ACRD22_01325 [Terriglobia bacterium]